MARRRRGLILTLAGPDGTGKSTVASMLAHEFERRGAVVLRQHYRPNVLFERHADGAAGDNPHASAALSAPAAVLKLLATALDTWVGLRRARRSADVSIVERGWWDQLVDPLRYRLEGRQAIVLGIGRWLPRADALIHLTGDMALVAARKPELSAQELLRQDAAWCRIAERAGRDAIRISTTCELPETAQVLSGVVDALVDSRWRLRRLRPGPQRLRVAASDFRAETLFAYQPRTRRARLACSVARRATALAGPARPVLLTTVGARFVGLTPQAVATFRGSATGRRIVGISSADGDAVVKINDQPDPHLQNEAWVLSTRQDLRDLMPEVIACGVTAGISFLATRRVLQSHQGHPPALSELAAVCARLQAARSPLVHGDMTPWNVTVGREGLVVLDWEASHERQAPALDACFYVVSAGALLGAWPPSGAVKVLSEEVMPTIVGTLRLDRTQASMALVEALSEIARIPGPRGRFATACLEIVTCGS